MASLRMYTPARFTRTAEVRAVLDPHENGGQACDRQVVWFDGLTLAEAQRLLALMPPEQARDRQNCAPSFAEMVALGARYPDMRFHGYRVDPSRSDERVTLEGFYIPVEFGEDVLAEVRYLPDEWDEITIDGRPYFRAWWD
jgi:hypothetical protein